MGAWHFIEPLLPPLLPADARSTYVGRDAAASPATGSYKVHQAEEADLVNRAFAALSAPEEGTAWRSRSGSRRSASR